MERRELEQEIDVVIEEASKRQLEIVIRDIEKDTNRYFVTHLVPSLNEVGPDLWTNARSLYLKKRNALENDLNSIFQDFGCHGRDLDDKKSELGDIAFEQLKNLLEEKANDVPMLMKESFLRKFTVVNGRPVKWGRGDLPKLEDLYRDAVVEAEKLLDIFSVIRLDNTLPSEIFYTMTETGLKEKETNVDETFESKLILMPASSRATTLQMFRSFAKAEYVSALQEVEKAAGQTGLKWYFFVIGLILAKDEVWWLLSVGLWNPVYLAILLQVFVLFWKLISN
eukprot:TRINITY_DN8708_c0_g3_i10.p1 TRINITY_DN8708_c0_g3~~TRINITY_DN8708_c0_g3_i10.p1  ORF type:complete len:282 (+),score=71.55 TRINITY_DN8708_c0_g3_i10:194-1039(+)